jgi:hypothetical protein
MMRLSYAAVAAAVIASSSASGQSPQIGEWICVASPDALFNLSFDAPKARINNFSLSESEAWMTDRYRVLALTAAASNRSAEPISMSVELIGADQNNDPVFAVTAEPGMGMVSAGKTEDISGDIYSEAGTLRQAERFCIRVSGDFGQ